MKVFIIAEAGVNHNGDVRIARNLIDVAFEAGADAVKFQTFRAENVVTEKAKLAHYQQEKMGEEVSQLEMIRQLELGFSDLLDLKSYADKLGITFLSTPFDIESARLLKELGLETFKISSGDITNYPLLREIAGYGKQVILSTGMADLGEIEDALDVLIENGTPRAKITVLHCNTEYPTPYEDVNLYAMLTIGRAFGVEVGYSDHTFGIEVPIAAAALGARIVEKHFTLDRRMKGPDHRASLEPEELKIMVRAIRNIEKALGNGIKKPSRSELRNIVATRRSIVAKTLIRRGEVFNDSNLTSKRPGNGVSPMRWNEIIGRKAPRDFEKDEKIEFW